MTLRFPSTSYGRYGATSVWSGPGCLAGVLEALLAEPALKEPGAAFWVMPTEEEGSKIAEWLRAQ